MIQYILVLIYVLLFVYVITYNYDEDMYEGYSVFPYYYPSARAYGYHFPYFYSGCIEDTFGNINCISPPYLF